jgi:hypothetical protein
MILMSPRNQASLGSKPSGSPHEQSKARTYCRYHESGTWVLVHMGSLLAVVGPPRHRSARVSRPHGSPCVTRSSMRKKAKSGRKKRSVTWRRVAGPDLSCVVARGRLPTSGPVAAGSERFSCTCCLVRLQTCIPSFNSSPRIRSAPQSRLSLAICLIKVMVSSASLGL